MKYFISLSFIPIILLLVGCGEGKPEGFPAKLFACRVVVMDGDEPVQGASVSLIPENEKQKYSMVSIANDDGVANIRTALAGYYGNGAPEGTYKVLIIDAEPPDLEHTLTADERANLPPDAQDAYEKARQQRIGARPLAVPKEFNKMDTTPLTWTVDRKGAELKVNVAEYKSK